MTELTLADDLAQHEAVIERGLNTFVEVGNALLAIRDERLYRADYTTFEDYCRERWGFNRHRAAQLISAAGVVTNVTSQGLPAPANEGQARELARVPEPERAEIWRETVERTGGKPTAAAIRETYQPPKAEPARSPEPAPEPDPPLSDADLLAGATWSPVPASLPAGQDRADEAVGLAEADARRDAELDAELEGTTQRFRANFARARRLAWDVTSFDAARVAEVHSANWDREVGDLLWRLREWCDEAEAAHRNRSGLKVIQGGAR